MTVDAELLVTATIGTRSLSVLSFISLHLFSKNRGGSTESKIETANSDDLSKLFNLSFRAQREICRRLSGYFCKMATATRHNDVRQLPTLQVMKRRGDFRNGSNALMDVRAGSPPKDDRQGTRSQCRCHHARHRR